MTFSEKQDTARAMIKRLENGTPWSDLKAELAADPKVFASDEGAIRGMVSAGLEDRYAERMDEALARSSDQRPTFGVDPEVMNILYQQRVEVVRKNLINTIARKAIYSPGSFDTVLAEHQHPLLRKEDIKQAALQVRRAGERPNKDYRKAGGGGGAVTIGGVLFAIYIVFRIVVAIARNN